MTAAPGLPRLGTRARETGAAVGVGVLVTVGVAVGGRVPVGVEVTAAAVAVAVAVGVKVGVGVMVGVAVGARVPVGVGVTAAAVAVAEKVAALAPLHCTQAAVMLYVPARFPRVKAAWATPLASVTLVAGDQAGEFLWESKSLVRRVWPLPSAFIT